jgi:hypothetical protein
VSQRVRNSHARASILPTSGDKRPERVKAAMTLRRLHARDIGRAALLIGRSSRMTCNRAASPRRFRALKFFSRRCHTRQVSLVMSSESTRKEK